MADGFVFSLDPDLVQFTKNDFRHLLPRAVAHDHVHAVLFGDTFHARGEIYRITHHGISQPDFRPHVAHADAPTVDSYADFDGRPIVGFEVGLELLQRVRAFPAPP